MAWNWQILKLWLIIKLKNNLGFNFRTLILCSASYFFILSESGVNLFIDFPLIFIYFYFHIYHSKFPPRSIHTIVCTHLNLHLTDISLRLISLRKSSVLGLLLLNSTEAFFNKHKSKASCEPLPHPRNGYIECTNKGTVLTIFNLEGWTSKHVTVFSYLDNAIFNHLNCNSLNSFSLNCKRSPRKFQYWRKM